MYKRTSRQNKLMIWAVMVAGLFFLIAGSESPAQTTPDDSAAPPLRVVSREELARLGLQRDVKRRTQATLDLMAARLTKAEALIQSEQFDEMYKELGGFHGLLENNLDFLNAGNKDSGKVLNNFKRFEMGLRQFRPRLEMIRRNIPLRYEHYLQTLIQYVREARAKAVEPLFGDSVVPKTKP